MEDQADKTKRIERRAALRKKIQCINDLETLHDLVPEEAKSIVEKVEKPFSEVSGDSTQPTEEQKQELLEKAKELNEQFIIKNQELKDEEAAQGAAAGESSTCDGAVKLTPEEISEFNTKMMGPEGVDELSLILMERILEEQERRKALVAEKEAAGNGAGKGGSRKRKRSKKRKGKGNKTRKNAQNNNNNNTTRRRKKTARRRRTKRA